jgi:hypothetical protein
MEKRSCHKTIKLKQNQKNKTKQKKFKMVLNSELQNKKSSIFFLMGLSSWNLLWWYDDHNLATNGFELWTFTSLVITQGLYHQMMTSYVVFFLLEKINLFATFHKGLWPNLLNP